jgi:hypothetical protein
MGFHHGDEILPLHEFGDKNNYQFTCEALGVHCYFQVTIFRLRRRFHSINNNHSVLVRSWMITSYYEIWNLKELHYAFNVASLWRCFKLKHTLFIKAKEFVQKNSLTLQLPPRCVHYGEVKGILVL